MSLTEHAHSPVHTSNFIMPLPSSRACVTWCAKKQFSTRNMLDRSIVSNISSSSDKETGRAAERSARRTNIRLAVGFTPLRIRIKLSFSVSIALDQSNFFPKIRIAFNTANKATPTSAKTAPQRDAYPSAPANKTNTLTPIAPPIF